MKRSETLDLKPIADLIGITEEELRNLDPETIEEIIAKKRGGKPLTFRSQFGSMSVRGNVLIAEDKMIPMENVPSWIKRFLR